MRARSLLRAVSWLISFSMLLASCSSAPQYAGYEGVTYLAPLGSPRAILLRWSPVDASKLLVNSSSITGGRAYLYLLNAGTGNSTELARLDSGLSIMPSWSPAGNSVALIMAGSADGASKNGLRVLDLKNRSLQYVSERDNGEAIWLRDGTTLAYFGVELFPRRLIASLIDTRSGAERILYSDPSDGSFRGASLSPDGKRIVFSMQASPTSPGNLYLINLETANISQLTHGKSAVEPSWSPKGGLIAYGLEQTADAQVGNQMRLISPDGSCDIEVPQLSDVLSPTWSPDGSRLAFVGPDGIYVVDLAKSLGTDISQSLCSGG